MTDPKGDRFLHVANGTSTTRLIAAAGLPGALSLWADPLHEGPVPGGRSDEELIDVRARHLGGHDAVDPVNDLRQWRAAIERHASWDELILWFEHDLFDQLNLIQLLSWIREHAPARKLVSLICVGSFPGHPRFKGLGELTPTELGSLLDTRQPVTGAQYALAQRAWLAFRDSTPEALDSFRRGDTTDLPYLARALTRFLQEYPWTTGGLSRSERRLLELASGDGIHVGRAFPRMHHGEDAYYITDLSLARMADALSRTSPPLLALTATAHATTTEFGASVVAGKRDRVETCGIDRWMGGVHLQGRQGTWRWDPVRHGITRR